MKPKRSIVLSLVAIVGLVACAKTKVTDQQTLVEGRQPRPGHIYVYDFVSNHADLPGDSALAEHVTHPTTPPTEEQIALGKKVGVDLATALVAEIAGMGLPALQVTSEPILAVNDLVIRGTLLSVEQGSAAERVAIGMGKGAAELKVAVEGFQMTQSGLRKLGSGDVDTQASKTPGAGVSLAVTLATKNPLGLIVSTGMKLHGESDGSSTIQGKVEQVAKAISAELKPKFQAQGWI